MGSVEAPNNILVLVD